MKQKELLEELIALSVGFKVCVCVCDKKHFGGKYQIMPDLPPKDIADWFADDVTGGRKQYYDSITEAALEFVKAYKQRK